MNILNRYIDGLLHIFFPDVCINCSNILNSFEDKICYRCLSKLEPARYKNFEDNEVTHIFEGRVPIIYGTAGFIYHKEGILQKLIFHLKYKNQENIGKTLGSEMANHLKDSKFEDIDYIIPVPLHPKKEKKRGYNQAELIAEGIAEKLGKTIATKSVYRRVHTDSQTKKNRIQRFENVYDIFGTTDDINLSNKHILLTDDIITTGSTIESCANALLKHFPTIKLSIACLAKAD